MKAYPQLLSRIFDTPLLIHQGKLESILGGLALRIGLSDVQSAAPAAAAGDEQYGPPAMPMASQPDGIACIDVFGPLVKRASGNFLSGGPTTYEEIQGAYTAALADPSIRGILLNIDSPGGEVGGIFDLAEMIYQHRADKPTYAVANDDAFSAAYLLASAAERVFVSQVGGVGSIGIVVAHRDQSGLDEKLGVAYTYLFAGARKIDFNPHQALSEAASAAMQSEIDRLYGMFCGAIAKYRRMSVDAVRGTEAGLSFGPNGVTTGLADQVGNCEDALAALAAATAPKSFRVASATNPNKELTSMPEPKPAATEEQKPAEAPQPPAVEAVKTAAEIKAEVDAQILAAREGERKNLAEVVDLCVLAGKLAMAPDMIRAGLSPAQAKEKLLEARAADSDANAVDSHAPIASTATLDSIKTQAEGVAKDQKISKEAAMVQLVAANPKLYEQYLASRQATQSK